MSTTPSFQARSIVVIPAYREARVIGEVVGSLRSLGWQTVVVDDGSRDHTSSMARSAGATVLRHPVNVGQGAALRTGFAWALGIQSCDFVVTFDADGQHDPNDVERLVAPIAAGRADVVLGSRFLRAVDAERIPLIRRNLLRTAALGTRVRTGLGITDSHNGLRAFHRDALARLRLGQDRMAHASEILREIARLSLRYEEVPVRIDYTEYSLAKGQRLTDAVSVLWDILTARMR